MSEEWKCHTAETEHRITKLLWLQGTAGGGHVVQLPDSSRAIQSKLPFAMSRWLWNISKEGD